MKLFMVRHGETDYNRQRRYQGRTANALNRTGLQQADMLHRRLLPETIDRIYTSNLIRAKDTARIIAYGRSIEVVSCENLAEMDFGELEGLTYDQITARYPDWQPTDFDFTLRGGESPEHFVRRMKAFAEKMRSNPAESNILVVAHAGCLRILLCLLLGIDIAAWWRFSLAPASLSVFENAEQEPVLTLLNDVSHLKSIRS